MMHSLAKLFGDLIPILQAFGFKFFWESMKESEIYVGNRQRSKVIHDFGREWLGGGMILDNLYRDTTIEMDLKESHGN